MSISDDFLRDEDPHTEEVDWHTLEEATHPVIPDGYEELSPVDLVPIDESKDA
jgi:hypothetical protein